MSRSSFTSASLITDPAVARPPFARLRPLLAALSELIALVRLWLARSRERRILYEMAQRDDYLLRDIGVSQQDAFREAEKPFWRR